jgi:hypothetical protein
MQLRHHVGLPPDRDGLQIRGQHFLKAPFAA